MTDIVGVVKTRIIQGTSDDPTRTPTPISVQVPPPLMTDVPQGTGKIKETLTQIKQSLDRLNGVPEPLDKALTLRDLIQTGLLTIDAGGGFVLGKGTGLVSKPGGIIAAPELSDLPVADGTFLGFPHLAVPPAPTNLRASGTIYHVILTWVQVDYSNYGYTEVWRSTVNNLGTATLIGTAVGRVYADEASIALGTTYYYWVRDVSNDTTPVTGAFNATAGTAGGAGKIGSTDLGPLIVLAGNLAAGSVTADKTLLDIGGDNLLGNNSFEVDANADGVAEGWAPYTGEPQTYSRSTGRIQGLAQRIAWTGVALSSKGYYTAGAPYGVRGGWKPNTTYVISIYAKVGATDGQGLHLSWTNTPAATVVIKNPTLSTNWQRYAWRITWASVVEANGGLRFETFGSQTYLDLDDAQVEEGDQLSGYQGKLAVNTIVAGDAAIANAAITNALIADLAVDTAKIALLAVDSAQINSLAVTTAKIAALAVTDAKIASLDAAKITTGFLDAARIQAGTIDASKINVSALSAITANIGTITAGDIHGVTLSGGNFTSAYAWPASGGGFHLSASGLLLGNAVTGPGFFQVNANGDLFSTQFSIVGGSASFSGTLSAAAGTFSGTLTAAAVNAVDTINIAGQAVTVTTSAASGSGVSITPGAAAVTVLTAPSLNVGASGSVCIVVTLNWTGASVTSGAGDTGGTSSSAIVPTYYIRRNGTLIAQWTPYSPNDGSGSFPPVGDSSYTVLDTPGGAAVYTLSHTAGTVTPAPFSNCVTRYRTIICLGTKR